MRILRLNDLYWSYLIYDYYPWLRGLSADEWSFQKLNDKLLFDAMGWHGCWGRSLAKVGGCVAAEISTNAEPVLLQWAVEFSDASLQKRAESEKQNWLQNGRVRDSNLISEIIVKFTAQFQPDAVLYDAGDVETLDCIRKECPSIKKVFGICGSAISYWKVFEKTDLVFSCAPETVEILNARGIKSVHVNHAFDVNMAHEIERETKSKQPIQLCFIGQLTAGGQFHDTRIDMLAKLSEVIDLEIFSPLGTEMLDFPMKHFLKKRVASLSRSASKIFGDDHALLQNQIFSRLKRIEATIPNFPRSVIKSIHRPVYGRDMLRVLFNSKIVLNIHADSSPRFASNMRLFEATGMGACLVTDDRPNLNELFRVGDEVVSFKSVEECVEKIRKLSEKPSEIARISANGRLACHQKHSFEARAEEYLRYFRGQKP